MSVSLFAKPVSTDENAGRLTTCNTVGRKALNYGQYQRLKSKAVVPAPLL